MATVLSNRRDAGYGTLSAAGPASYAAGGFSFDPKSDLGQDREPVAVFVDSSSQAVTGRWNSSTKKIVAILRANGLEPSDTSDLSGVTFVASAFFPT